MDHRASCRGRRLRTLLATGVYLAIVSGCEMPPAPPPMLAPVRGVVLLDGAPVERALVEFIQEGAPWRSSGLTDVKGRFVLTSLAEGDGAPVGRHKVVISRREVIFDQRAVADAHAVDRWKIDQALGKTIPLGPGETPLEQPEDLDSEGIIVEFADSFEEGGESGSGDASSTAEPDASKATEEPVDFPVRYASPGTTDIELEVVPGKANDFKIVLTR